MIMSVSNKHLINAIDNNKVTKSAEGIIKMVKFMDYNSITCKFGIFLKTETIEGEELAKICNFTISTGKSESIESFSNRIHESMVEEIRNIDDLELHKSRVIFVAPVIRQYV